jgi:hypothetical protein
LRRHIKASGDKQQLHNRLRRIEGQVRASNAWSRRKPTAWRYSPR